MKKHFRDIGLCLFLALTVGLAACGKEPQEQSGGSLSGAGDLVYTAGALAMPVEAEYFSYFAVHNDRIYVEYDYYSAAADAPAGDEEPLVQEADDILYPEEYGASYVSETRIASFLPDGSDLREFTYRGESENASVPLMTVDEEGNIWIVECVAEYAEDGTDGTYSAYTETYWLVQLDSEGNPLLRKEIAGLAAESAGGWAYISAMALGADGNVFLLIYGETQSCIGIFDAEGNRLHTLELAETTYAHNLVRTGDGTVLLCAREEAGNLLREIDAAAGDWGEDYGLSLNYNSIITGPGSTVYLSDSSALRAFDVATGETTEVLTWLNSGVAASYINGMGIFSDGTVVVTDYDQETWKIKLLLLTPQDASEAEEKTPLTLAAYYLDSSLRAAIVEYNQGGGDYQIQVTEYSQYDNEKDWDGGLTKLNADIIAGNIPDILYLDGLPAQRYAAAGLLADLYPYIDSDTALSRDSFPEAVLASLETDGKLYQTASSFYISTAVGNARFVGGEQGITFAALQALQNAMPEGTTLLGDYFTRNTFLNYILWYGSGDFVDWYSGECRFDSAEFISILNYAASLPEEYDWSRYETGDYVYESEYARLLNGTQLLYPTTVSNVEEIQMLRALLGDDLNFIGFPSAEGAGTALQASFSFGISSVSAHKDAAWEFVRRFLTAEYQESTAGGWSFPTNQAALEAALMEAMTPKLNENGVEIGSWSMYVTDEQTIEIHVATQADIDAFWALLGNVRTVIRNETGLVTLIQEEAEAFFAGTQTAERTAEIIQNRVTIYINE